MTHTARVLPRSSRAPSRLRFEGMPRRACAGLRHRCLSVQAQVSPSPSASSTACPTSTRIPAPDVHLVTWVAMEQTARNAAPLVSPCCPVEWSQRGDSNPRPPDYKSGALPTELRWRLWSAFGLVQLSVDRAGSRLSGHPRRGRERGGYGLASPGQAPRRGKCEKLGSGIRLPASGGGEPRAPRPRPPSNRPRTARATRPRAPARPSTPPRLRRRAPR